jgi:hypothetical protein
VKDARHSSFSRNLTPLDDEESKEFVANKNEEDKYDTMMMPKSEQRK